MHLQSINVSSDKYKIKKILIGIIVLLMIVSLINAKADQNSPRETYNLGLRYMKGKGVKKDMKMAHKLFLKSANMGYARAQYIMGILYHKRISVKQDNQKAFKWFEMASRQNVPEALYMMGLLYEEGKGTKKDIKKAIDYYVSAADLGEKRAVKRIEKEPLLNKDLELQMKGADAVRKSNYKSAIGYFQKSLVIRDKVLGKGSINTVKIYKNLANNYEKVEDHSKALKYRQKSLAINEKVLGKEHPDTAISYNNIGGVYESMGDDLKALEYYQKALAIREKVLGKEHPDTAASYDDIGDIYRAMEDYPKALEYYEKALAIKEKVLGTEHPDTAASYYNIGDVYSAMGNYLKALVYSQKALAIELGKEHPDNAISYDKFGADYKSRGYYPKALEYYQKALAMREKVLGKEHPDTAVSYDNIGDVHGLMGDDLKALEYYQKALAIREKVLEKEHPDTAASYYNIGDVYSSMEDDLKALEYYQKALAIREKVLGKEHPDTAASYDDIGDIYRAMEDYPKALEYYQKALAIREKVLGKEHPDTAASYDKIGDLHGLMEYYLKMLEYSQKDLAIGHPDNATSYDNIGDVHGSMEDYLKALEYYQKSLAIKEKLLGKKHPDNAISYDNIGDVYRAMEDYPKALEYYQKALAIREKVPGKEHPDTAASYDNIGDVHGSMEDYPKALEYYQKALAIREKVLGKEHLDTAASYDKIGDVHGLMEDYLKMLEYSQKALAIELREKHPDNATSYDNIDDVYRSMIDDEDKDYLNLKAFVYSQKALAIELGKEHTDKATSYDKIGAVYKSRGDYLKVLEYYQKSLAISEEGYGPLPAILGINKQNGTSIKKKINKDNNKTLSKIPVSYRQNNSNIEVNNTLGDKLLNKRVSPLPNHKIDEYSQISNEKEKHTIVDILYGTDRKRNPKKSDWEYYYTGKRGKLKLGVAEVNIPKIHKFGEMERPNKHRVFGEKEKIGEHVLIDKLETIDEKKFLSFLKGNLYNTGKKINPKKSDLLYYNTVEKEFLSFLKTKLYNVKEKDIVIFIHGYNISFAEAIRRTAQISYDLELKAIPMAYSWPSRGKNMEYFNDAASVQDTVPYLVAFLKTIIDGKGDANIHVIGQGMGARALANALKEISFIYPGKHVFKNIILAEPNIDRDIFQIAQLPYITKTADKITLYTISDAPIAAHEENSIGKGGDDVFVDEGLDTIDAIIGTNNSILHHSYFEGPKVLMAEEVFLQLDTGGHTAQIQDIIATKSGDIITISNDKTIRVWDSKTGEEKRKILGQIGQGSKGMIHTMALSPDEEQLAVGGDFENNEIRIYHYPTGILIKVLKAHTKAVFDLSYSPDSKYLISGSKDHTAKIWDISKNFSLIDTITQHTNYVQAVKIIKKADTYLAITVGYDNQIALYDIKKRKNIASDKADYKLKYLATSDKHIAVCGKSKEIRIYNYHLKLIHTIESETKPAGVSYSPDGKLLIAGTSIYPRDINIYNKEKNYSRIATFKKHKNFTTKAVTFFNNNLALTAGGQNNEVYIWNSKTAEVKRKIEGVGATVRSVGIKGDIIGWRNKERNMQNESSWNMLKTLNLKTFRINSEQQIVNNLKKISTTYGNLSLTHTSGGDYGSSDATLILKKDKKEITIITRDATCYGFYKNYIISGGENGYLKIYNQKGEEIANLVGHTEEILSIALDGNKLVSGSRDQTIRIWDLSQLAESLKMKITNITPHSIVDRSGLKVGDIIHSVDKKKFNSRKEFNKYLKPIKSYTFYFSREGKDMKLTVDKTKKSFGFRNIDVRVREIEPQLNIFISKINDYIAWTEEGYFTASEEGMKYLYFHLNQGAKKEAKVIPMKKLYGHFFRPDLIQLKLSGDEEAYQKATKGLNFKSALQNQPPTLSFNQTAKKTDKEKIALSFTIEDGDGGIGLIRVYQEGKLIQTIGEGKVNKQSANMDTIREQEILNKTVKIKQKTYMASLSKSIEGKLPIDETIAPVQPGSTTNKAGTYTIDLDLMAGNNEISIEAFNKTNTVVSSRETITVHADIPKRKRKLYAIVAGVNEFESHSVNSLKYSQNDAKDIKEMLEKKMNSLFESVEVTYLTGQDLTKDNILKAAKEIAPKAQLEDTVIFYISTHGRAAGGKLYLVPYNNKYAKNWIDFEQIFKSIQSIKALNQIFVIDTCESGKANDIVSAVYDSRASVLARSSGVHMLLATTKGTFAFEHSDPTIHNGVFTYKILQAMRNKTTDSNNDKIISILELSKKLKEPKNNADYQYPVIRNVGSDVGLRRVK